MSDVDELTTQLKRTTNLSSSSGATREFINVDVVGANKNVGLITLNRPKALNALCAGLMNEVEFRLVLVS